MIPSKVPSVLAAYGDLLASKYLESAVASVADGIARRDLTFLGRSICNVLRPRFVASSDYASSRDAAKLVSRGLMALVARLRKDDQLRGELQLAPMEEAFIQFEPPSSRPLMGRIDGFLVEGAPIQFIEFNSAPFGVYAVENLGGLFSDTPIMAELRSRYELWTPSTMTAGFEALNRVYSHRMKGRLPTIGYIRESAVLADAPATQEARGVLNALAERGVNVVHIESEAEASLENDRLLFAGVPIDLVRIDRNIDMGGPIVTAIRSSFVELLNGAANTILLGHKGLFAMLSDPRHGDIFDAEVKQAIDRHVPWTRVVRETKTTYRGEAIDLMPFLAEHRERFVLKTTRAYGGQGIVLGWETEAEAWSRALAAAMEEHQIVQERVSIPREAYPLIVDGKLVFEELYSDLDPFVWGGDEQAEACLVRVSPSGILNMTAGAGSLTGMFVVK